MSNYKCLNSVKEIRSELISCCKENDISAFRKKAEQIFLTHSNNLHILEDTLVLHLSVWFNDLDLWMRAIELNCSPFNADNLGDSALHYAARALNIQFIQYVAQKYGFDALWVYNTNASNILMTICSEAPDHDANKILFLLEWLYLHGFTLEDVTIYGQTALQLAISRKSLIIVQWLISHQAHIGHRDVLLRSVLHTVAVTGTTNMLSLLLNAGARPLLYSVSIDCTNATPAILAYKTKSYKTFLAFYMIELIERMNFKLRFKSIFGFIGFLYFTLMCLLLPIMSFKAASLEKKFFWYKLELKKFLVALLTYFSYLYIKNKPPIQMSELKKRTYYQKVSPNIQTELENYIDRVKQYTTYSNSHIISLLQAEYEIKANIINYNNSFWRNPQVSDSEIEFMQNSFLKKIDNIRNQIQVRIKDISSERCSLLDKDYVMNIMAADEPNNTFCYTCRSEKNCRAKHCTDCGYCIDKFDHHCTWLNNCIGLNNQRAFIFHLCCLLYFQKHYYEVFYKLMKNLFLKSNDTTTQLAKHSSKIIKLFKICYYYYLLIGISLINVLVTAFTIYMTLRTFRAMLTDVTFYETVRPGSHIFLRFKNSMQKKYFWDFSDLSIVGAIL